jgi:hypothetical protein
MAQYATTSPQDFFAHIRQDRDYVVRLSADGPRRLLKFYDIGDVLPSAELHLDVDNDTVSVQFLRHGRE